MILSVLLLRISCIVNEFNPRLIFFSKGHMGKAIWPIAELVVVVLPRIMRQPHLSYSDIDTRNDLVFLFLENDPGSVGEAEREYRTKTGCCWEGVQGTP